MDGSHLTRQAFIEYSLLFDGAQVAAIGAGDQGKALSYLERAVAAARIAYGRDAPEVAHVQQMVEMMEPTRDASPTRP